MPNPTPIRQNDHGWVIETRTTAYALGMNSAGMLAHRYWGARLPRLEDYPPAPAPIEWASFNGAASIIPLEYPGYAGTDYTEPCLKVAFADHVRDVVLRFDRADIEGDMLTLTLKDAHYPLTVQLHYQAYVEYDLIARWATVINAGTAPIRLERVASAQWHVPFGGDYRLTHLSGKWYDEMHLRREPLLPGVKVIESRRITTSHQHSPFFAIDRGHADETSGEVWLGVLVWSGNWKLMAEVTEFASTRVSIGINDWDFDWTLNAGERFTTPYSLGTYSAAGYGNVSRALHNFIREMLLPHGRTPHKVLYNSWEATFFAVDEPSQTQLAELAAEMGVELFVMDDGWFRGRSLDNAGLGDWIPDAVKFPNGLNPLIARVNALGMDFGLWIEPEMVNPDSDLYRAHPDWAIHFPTRQHTQMRSQLILNLGREDVQDNLIAQIDWLLTHHNIAFIKWDMNRNVSEPGWAELGEQQRELWVRYVQGVYRVWGTLRERHPQVIWQSCSGGGGRADLGILRFADQVWISDNTEPTARLGIQEGYSMVFPASTMEAWVTDSGAPYVPLSFRFHVSMCGSLGIGGHLLRWTSEQRAEAADHIARYKAIREIVQFGDQYRLISAQANAFSAVQYMSKDKRAGVLFVFRTHLPTPAILPPILLQGLEPEALYAIEGFEHPRSGAAWMRAGLRIELHDYQSALRSIQRVGTNS
ncbi:MAG: alpha-galactosidase [Anaerolineae bacterium]|nr:alpha-galactosidase [Anaerolineae bacterium]NUQ05614.1 alpha-galactosidase [Anaerolineae bacterium]